MQVESFFIIFAALALVVGGTVKGYSGIGLPMISIPALTLLFPIETSIGLLAIPILLANILQAQRVPGRILKSRWFLLLSCSLISGIIFGAVLFQSTTATLAYMLGSSMIIYSILAISGFQLHIRNRLKQPLAVFFGLFAGFTGGSTSLYGWPLVVYISSINLSPGPFVAAISLLYLLGHIGFMAMFWLEQGMNAQLLFYSTAACIPVYSGIKLGQLLRKRITNSAIFFNAIYLLLLISGCKLILTT